MHKLIFLDFDGVMNNRWNNLYRNIHHLPEKDEFGVLFDPDCIAALKHIIDETGAEVVVSSSWKDYMAMDEIRDMWRKRNLPGTPIDVTPTISQHRGEEIVAWMAAHPNPCQFVIIDDEPCDQFQSHQLPHLITTNNFEGLTMPIAIKAIEVLNHTPALCQLPYQHP